MWLDNAVTAILLIVSLLVVLVKGKLVSEEVPPINFTIGSSSPWLKKSTNLGWPRPPGCWSRPWVCRDGEHPPWARMRCCRNQCVDVFSDPNNCGLCGIRCPFTWQCCRGFCVDTNISPFNCGKCGNRCPWGVQCVYGMCGYAQPWPPQPPFPFPPPRPRPPFPFPPPQPRPPFPFPPPQPRPPFPFPTPWPRPPFPFPPPWPRPPFPFPPAPRHLWPPHHPDGNQPPALMSDTT